MMPTDSDLTSNRSNVSCSVHSLPPAAPLPCKANDHIKKLWKKKKKHWQLGLVLGDLPWDSSLSKYLYGGQSSAGQLACLCPSLGSSASAEQGEPGMKSKDFIATVSQESLCLLGIKREVTPVSPVGGGGATAPNQREYQPERWNVGLVEGPWGEVCSQHQPGSSPAPTAPKRHALWGGKKKTTLKVNI